MQELRELARRVREDLEACEISGSDPALDQLEALLDRLDPQEA